MTLLSHPQVREAMTNLTLTVGSYTEGVPEVMAAEDALLSAVMTALAGAKDETHQEYAAKALYDMEPFAGLDGPWWDELTPAVKSHYRARAQKVEPILNAFWRAKYETAEADASALRQEIATLRARVQELEAMLDHDNPFEEAP